MSGTLVYVYAVSRDLPADAVSGMTGVDAGPVRLVAAGPLTAVVGDVDREAFTEQALEERREDLTWLAATARAHHHVVDTVGRRAPVAPLALGTVYFDDERVRGVLAERRAELTAVLDRVAGRTEWGVKAWVRAGSSSEDSAPRARSGAEYLRRRRQALRDRDEGFDDAAQAADDVHERAAALAVAARRHRPQESTLTGRTERMVLNGAYLTAEPDGLRALVGELADHPRLRVELTGPWVPYSFADGDVAGAEEAG